MNFGPRLNSFHRVEKLHFEFIFTCFPTIFIIFLASGEPPLLLSASVHTAIRQAIGAARKEIKEDGASPQSFKGFFRLDSPATMEKIRANCGYENVDLFLKEMAEVVSDS